MIIAAGGALDTGTREADTIWALPEQFQVMEGRTAVNTD
jgi:hypothetical protein